MELFPGDTVYYDGAEGGFTVLSSTYRVDDDTTYAITKKYARELPYSLIPGSSLTLIERGPNWKPRTGERVLVSMDGENYHERFFLYSLPNGDSVCEREKIADSVKEWPGIRAMDTTAWPHVKPKPVKAPVEMTIQQLEEKLGHPVKIIR